jgi:GNAT superfamily N-acetyltransferase
MQGGQSGIHARFRWHDARMPAPDVAVLDRFDAKYDPQLIGLFAEQWWTTHRTIEQTRAAVDASPLVLCAVDRERDELVGFTRVLSDGVFVALVLDVVVAAPWRGRGVGAVLMDAVTTHPSIRAVESIELVCQPGLMAFYARWGFTDQVGSSRLMRRTERSSLLGPLNP